MRAGEPAEETAAGAFRKTGDRASRRAPGGAEKASNSQARMPNWTKSGAEMRTRRCRMGRTRLVAKAGGGRRAHAFRSKLRV